MVGSGVLTYSGEWGIDLQWGVDIDLQWGLRC